MSSTTLAVHLCGCFLQISILSFHSIQIGNNWRESVGRGNTIDNPGCLLASEGSERDSIRGG